ncbi:hypothetical protein HF200_34175, partial [Streptomyces galbus]|nr:hypothetical protein [Streptomyces galbus]
PAHTPTTFRDGPLSFRNNPTLWRNNQLLRNNADRPGALAGHYGLKGAADFLAAGSGEALGEILIKGAFDGDWSTSWSTFVGAGLSSQVESTLMGTAVNSSAELRHAIDKLRLNPPTVSGGDHGSAETDAPRSRGGDGHGNGDGHGDGDRTTGPGRDATGAGAPAPVNGRTTSNSASVNGTSSPSADLTQSTPPPPYTAVDPPAYSPGPLPMTAAENALWQQVHTGTPDLREQALRDITALRGGQQPHGAEIGVRDGLHSALAQLPEVRVVPAGNGPTAQVDADGVRRALDSLGVPVTVDGPRSADTAIHPDTPAQAPGVDGRTQTPQPQSTRAPDATPAAHDLPGTEEAPHRNPATEPADSGGTTDSPQRVPDTAAPAPGTSTSEPPKVTTTSSADGSSDAPAGGPVDVDVDVKADSVLPGTTDATHATHATDSTDTTRTPFTVVVSELPPPAPGSPEAAALLDGAGTDRAVVLGPPAPADGTGRPVRPAVELTREGPGRPVQVRQLTGPAPAPAADAPVPGVDARTDFPGSDVLVPLADALGAPVSTDPSLQPTTGPSPRPATESGPTGGSGPVTDTASDLVPDPSSAGEKPIRTDSAAPDANPRTDKLLSDPPPPARGDRATTPEPVHDHPAPGKLATLSRTWAEPATGLHLESGDGSAGRDGALGGDPGARNSDTSPPQQPQPPTPPAP